MSVFQNRSNFQKQPCPDLVLMVDITAALLELYLNSLKTLQNSRGMSFTKLDAAAYEWKRTLLDSKYFIYKQGTFTLKCECVIDYMT